MLLYNFRFFLQCLHLLIVRWRERKKERKKEENENEINGDKAKEREAKEEAQLIGDRSDRSSREVPPKRLIVGWKPTVAARCICCMLIDL